MIVKVVGTATSPERTAQLAAPSARLKTAGSMAPLAFEVQPDEVNSADGGAGFSRPVSGCPAAAVAFSPPEDFRASRPPPTSIEMPTATKNTRTNPTRLLVIRLMFLKPRIVGVARP